jgi:ligand-binding SRPBCC domain-containing protein
MPTVILETLIMAPAEICFDLMRDIRLHTETTAHTNERAVAGGDRRMIGLGQTVAFESTHFGLRQRLTVKVVEFDRPRLFTDEMIEAPFKSFRHTHQFFDTSDGTLMRDTLIWESPFGILGRLADKLLIENHLKNLVSARNARLKEIAEND